MRSISWLAEDLLASHEGLCSMESVLYLTVSQNWNLRRVTFLVPRIWSWLLYFFGKSVDPVNHSSSEVNLLVMGTSSTGTNHRHAVPTRQGTGWVANTNKSALKKSTPNRPQQSRLKEENDLSVLFHIMNTYVTWIATQRHIIPNLYRVIKKFLCTWWLQYRKLQVMFKVSPASLQTFIDTPNCVLEDRVQYSTVRIPSVFCDSHLQIISCVGIILSCNRQVYRDFQITLYIPLCQINPLTTLLKIHFKAGQLKVFRLNLRRTSRYLPH
jgi:hypothetical protein